MQVKNMALDDFFKYLPMHDYGASSTPQHKTCALVGNSGILLDSKVGAARCEAACDVFLKVSVSRP
jgi:hypothetical protein